MANRGSFKKGNRVAKGHGRPKGSGTSMRLAVEDMLSVVRPLSKEVELADGRKVKEISLHDLAVETLIRAMQSRDENGYATHTAFQAAKEVAHLMYGKPRERAEIKVVTEERSVRISALLTDRVNALAEASMKGLPK